MKIILEGSECNFKTTIANKLKEALDYEVVKGSSFELATGTSDELYNHFNEIISREDDLIIDRFIYSNIVYASLFPEYTILSKKDFDNLDVFINNNDSDILTFYLYADVDTLKERLKKRGDSHIKENHLSDINKIYELVMNNSEMKAYHIDTTVMNSGEIVAFILHCVNNRLKARSK